MECFLEKHASKIIGVLSCFDRMLCRGYLPIMSGVWLLVTRPALPLSAHCGQRFARRDNAVIDPKRTLNPLDSTDTGYLLFGANTPYGNVSDRLSPTCVLSWLYAAAR